MAHDLGLGTQVTRYCYRSWFLSVVSRGGGGHGHLLNCPASAELKKIVRKILVRKILVRKILVRKILVRKILGHLIAVAAVLMAQLSERY